MSSEEHGVPTLTHPETHCTQAFSPVEKAQRTHGKTIGLDIPVIFWTGVDLL